MKTNPWFVCVVVFELERSCKTKFVHIQSKYTSRIPRHTKPVFCISLLSRKTNQIAIKTSAKMRLVCNKTMVNKSMATTEFKP